MLKLKRRIIHIIITSVMTSLIIILLIMSLKTADTTQEVTDKAVDKISHFYIEEIAKNRASLISNELDKKYNLAQIIVSIIKDGFGRYEVYYKDYTKETEADRVL